MPALHQLLLDGRWVDGGGNGPRIICDDDEHAITLLDTTDRRTAVIDIHTTRD